MLEANQILQSIAWLTQKYSSLAPEEQLSRSDTLLEDFFTLAEQCKELIALYSIDPPKKNPQDTLLMARLKLENNVLREELKQFYPTEFSFQEMQKEYYDGTRAEVDALRNKCDHYRIQVNTLLEQIDRLNLSHEKLKTAYLKLTKEEKYTEKTSQKTEYSQQKNIQEIRTFNQNTPQVSDSVDMEVSNERVQNSQEVEKSSKEDEDHIRSLEESIRKDIRIKQERIDEEYEINYKEKSFRAVTGTMNDKQNSPEKIEDSLGKEDSIEECDDKRENSGKFYQDESFKISYQDKSFKNSYQAESFRSIHQDESLKNIHQEESSKNIYQDESFKNVHQDESFKNIYQDESFRILHEEKDSKNSDEKQIAQETDKIDCLDILGQFTVEDYTFMFLFNQKHQDIKFTEFSSLNHKLLPQFETWYLSGSQIDILPLRSSLKYENLSFSANVSEILILSVKHPSVLKLSEIENLSIFPARTKSLRFQDCESIRIFPRVEIKEDKDIKFILDKFVHFELLPKVPSICLEKFGSIAIVPERKMKIQFARTVNVDSQFAEEGKSDSGNTRRPKKARKPAIEEYFTLTVQAIKLNMSDRDKLPQFSPDDLFKIAQNEAIPFNQWYNWVTDRLNSMVSKK